MPHTNSSSFALPMRFAETTATTKWIVYAMTTALLAGGAVVVAYLPARAHYSAAFEPFVSQIHAITPQGWAFFTRDPRTPFAFALPEKSIRVETQSRQADAEFAFGLDRTARLTEARVDGFIREAEAAGAEWTSCSAKESLRACLSRSEPVELKSNPIDASCEDAAILRRDPTPFAFANRVTRMPYELIRVAFTC